jgi:hypothetical protein
MPFKDRINYNPYPANGSIFIESIKVSKLLGLRINLSESFINGAGHK